MGKLLERLNWIMRSRGGAICFIEAKVVEEKEPVADDESGGVVTTVKENVTKDLDVQELLDEQDDDEKEKTPAKDAPKPAAKKEGDEDQELDFKSLTPEQQAAVGKVYKGRREDRRKIRELTRAVEELKKTKPSSEREEAPVVPKTTVTAEDGRPEKPKPENFNSPAEFEKAEIEYEDKLHDWREAKKEAKRMEGERAKAQELAIKAHNERQEKFAEEHDDYEDVIDNDLPMSDLMFGAVVEEELGPALAYYWAQNPEESNKVFAMPPHQQIKAIIRTIIKLEAGGEKPKNEDVKPPKKKQPEPPEPIGGRQATPKDVSKMSFKEREKAFARDNPGLISYIP